jgi:CRP/FNR family cyclic AMP-dependent transcriptional regulator
MAHQLNLSKIARFLGVIEIISLRAGEFLFREGDAADGLFIVRSGQVQVTRRGTVYDDVSGGGIVGELAIVDEGARSASVRAATSAELIKVDVPGFLALVENEPEFALTVMRVMARRLRLMNDRDQASAA